MEITDKFSILDPLRSTDNLASKVFVGRLTVGKKPASTRPPMIGIKVLGTGFSTGSQFVRNEDLATRGYDSDWIIQRTGIKSRYHVAEGESTSDMAIRAAENCLAQAGVDASVIDLIIVATVTPDHATPSTACIVQAHLGCSAPAFDINAACSGFIYSLITGSQFIQTGASKNVLVIGAETISMILDPADKRTFPLFGDGAGAVLISSNATPDDSQASGILAYRIAADGKLGNSLRTPAGGSRRPFSQQVLDEGAQFLEMDGRAVFKWAVRLIPEIVNEMLTKASMSLDEIDLFIPHQANVRIIDAAINELGIDRSKVFVNLDRYGNTSAASIPISIAEAVQQGRIKPGSNILMVGFGAGLTWGACLMRW